MLLTHCMLVVNFDNSIFIAGPPAPPASQFNDSAPQPLTKTPDSVAGKHHNTVVSERIL